MAFDFKIWVIVSQVPVAWTQAIKKILTVQDE